MNEELAHSLNLWSSNTPNQENDLVPFWMFLNICTHLGMLLCVPALCLALDQYGVVCVDISQVFNQRESCDLSKL